MDWLAVPAGICFVWVVQALYRGTFRDLNSTGRAVPGSTGRLRRSLRRPRRPSDLRHTLPLHDEEEKTWPT